MSSAEALQYFQERIGQNRFWWFREKNYLPPIYASLHEEELKTLIHWFNSTEKTHAGECNIPLMSFLLGFIGGSDIHRIVQLGHYMGYSTLLIGWMLRQMGRKHGLYTVDIDETVTGITRDWIQHAGLGEYVRVVRSDSTDLGLPNAVSEYFGVGKPAELIFIDSSHAKGNTLKELHLWMAHLSEGGFIVLHDSSIQGATYDKTKAGGVLAALQEYNHSNTILINKQVGCLPPGTNLVYKDGCGLAILQKGWE